MADTSSCSRLKRDAWFMVARHGDGPWESSGQRESIGPESKTITVSHTLQHGHELFRIQAGPGIRWSKPTMVHFEDIRIEVSRSGSALGSYALKRTVSEVSGSAPKPDAPSQPA
jgi:hypothetical protein